MRAKREYEMWCALERQYEKSRFSPEQERAYITGFNRAIEIIEKLLKERSDEIMAEINPSQIGRAKESGEVAIGSRY